GFAVGRVGARARSRSRTGCVLLHYSSLINIFKTFPGAPRLQGRALFFVLIQFERRRINAIPQSGRPRSIVEHMTQVRFAPAALNLGASHSVGRIAVGRHGLLVGWRVKTRPTRSRMILCLRPKKRLTAAHALVRSGALRVLIFPRKRRL